MLTVMRARDSWRSEVSAADSATLGWCGWLEPRLARAPGVDVVVDGTIFNRSDFPRAASDAELIAALYRRHGFAGTLARLNGDFAIALHDAGSGTTWLGRDRFGVKPLYYVADANRLAFGSRLVALLGLPGVDRTVNHRFVALFAASHYRYFDNQPHESPYRDIAQLPAGHLLRWTGGVMAIERYWVLEPQLDIHLDEGALAEQYRELLMDAVSIRYVAADRPAFTLSGGMDSSSVLACAVRASGNKQRAFSTVYDDPTYDEREDVQTMIESSVSEWRTVAIGMPDVIGDVTRMIAMHDEPVATATWLSHYTLCQDARCRDVGALFGGLGGDELNAGEYEYFFFFFADLLKSGDDAVLEHEIREWIVHHDHPIFRKSRSVAFAGFDRLVDLTRAGVCRADRTRLEKYSAALAPGFFDLAAFEPAMDHPFASYLRNRTLQDIGRETLPCCLRAEDRHATNAEIEHIAPLLDHRLAEFMFRVPGRLKIRDGVTKHLLREAMRGVLPEETRTRIKKTGWNAPAHRWFSGSGKSVVLDLVASKSFRERGIYDVAEVRRIIDEHDRIVASGQPQENHMMFLWQLVNLELWLRWVDALPAAAA